MLDNESRRIMWKAYPLFGIVDRLYLLSGPAGILLLFVDWRVGLLVVLVVVPLLYSWKQRLGRRALERELHDLHGASPWG